MTTAAYIETTDIHMIVRDGLNDDAVVTQVVWPEWIYESKDEPDYDEVVEDMVPALLAALDAENLRVVNRRTFMQAVRQAVEPGAAYEPMRFTLETGDRPNDPERIMGVTPDSRDVPVRMADGALSVSICDDEEMVGSRVDTVPSILVKKEGVFTLWLTWNEAKDLVTALNEIVGIAENG